MIRPKIIVKKEFLLNAVLLSIIYISLELYYNYYISAQYTYMGYIPDLSIFKYIITKAVFISVLVLSYSIYKQNKFLYSVYLLLVFFFYIPVAVLFSFSNFAIGPFAATTFFVCCFALSPYIKFPISKGTVPSKWKQAILISVSMLMFIPIAIRYGLDMNLKTLKLSEIYETRESFSKNLHGVLAYFYNIEAKAIIPVALIFFMIHKRYFIVLLCTMILLYLYVISGNRIVYFTSIIVVFFYFVGKDFASKLSNFFLLILILFAIFPILDNLILTTPILVGTFVNRFLFIPALLTNFYFDFFNGNPFYFAESNFFNLFIKNPYDMEIGFLITQEYWGAPTAYANNGIVSDGFMNLGYIGVIIFTLAFILLFSLFNSFQLHKGYFGIYFSYLFLLLSVSFFSCFVTGGLLIFIILSAFVLKTTSKEHLHLAN